MRGKLAIALALLLSGCSTYSLEELRHVTPSGSEFNQTLTRLYLDYAETQARHYDWYDSMLFADKGLLTAYDHEVGPENLDNWTIPLDILPVMTKVRADLLVAMNPKNMAERPVIAAEAQFYFDCWVESTDDGAQTEDADYCRDHLKDRLEELNDTSFRETLKAEGDAPQVDSSTYIVFFDWGQAKLNDEGNKVVDSVVEAFKPETSYEIVLNAHTDRSGGDQYNQKLSKRRAEAVGERLAAGGVKPESITIYAFGESDPSVKTKDGVKEKANRRVEIVLSE